MRERENDAGRLEYSSANVGQPASEPAGHAGTQQAWLSPSPPLGTVTGAAGCVHIQAYSTHTHTQAWPPAAVCRCLLYTDTVASIHSLVGWGVIY